MSGSFNAMRIAIGGALAARRQLEVTSSNIAHASDANYSRQQVTLSSAGSLDQGGYFVGQGVQVEQITRIRDALLDSQVRGSTATSSNYSTKLDWFKRLESIYNEPSDNGLAAGLTNVWSAFSQLSVDPEDAATRANVMSSINNMTALIRNADSKLESSSDDIDAALRQSARDITALTKQISELNGKIFVSEAGNPGQANDLRDSRDAAITKLSALANITVTDGGFGMVNVFVGDHMAVVGDKSEPLMALPSSQDASKLAMSWGYGDKATGISGGSLGAILEMQSTVLPAYRESLDGLASAIINEVNRIYANSVPRTQQTFQESALGFESLGVTKSSDSLSLLPSGQTGEIHIAFQDASGKVVRTAGIVVQSTDSLDDIVSKLDGIPGLSATLLSSVDNNGRLRLELEPGAAGTLGTEAGIVVANQTGGFDTSGFLSLVGLAQEAKSSQAANAVQKITGGDLSLLQTTLGEPDVASVRAHALGKTGSFTINLFDRASNVHMQQFAVQVVSTDSINSIMAKVNAQIPSQYGVQMVVNGSNQLELQSTAETDGNSEQILGAGPGTNRMRLSFSNTYQYPNVSSDAPPSGYNGLGDNTGLLSKMHFNTLLQGSSARDIALDARIRTEGQISAGYRVGGGDNGMALAMNALQSQRVLDNQQFTIGEEYQKIVSQVGSDVSLTKNLSDNESVVLSSFRTQASSVSGVSLDEELAKMIEYQKAFQANGRLLQTLSQVIDEILKL